LGAWGALAANRRPGRLTSTPLLRCTTTTFVEFSTIFCRLASLFVVHDLQTHGSTLSAGPQSDLPVSWSELLVQPVVAPPWLLAVTLPCRRRLHPSQPDRLGCLSVALIVSCVIRSVGRSGLTNSRHLPTHETCGQPSTVYLVVVNGRETELVLTNSLGSLLTRWNGSGPLHLDRHRRHTVPFHLVRHSLSSRLCRRTTSALLLPAYLTSLLPLIRYQFQC